MGSEMCIRDRHGVELRRLPDDVVQRLSELSAEVVNEMAGDDPLAQRIVKSYQEFAASAKPYSEISEQAYLNAR